MPVLVKVSYFPNWTAHGAEGPYRIAPNMMVVVPTSNDVRLTFDRSRSDLFFYALTGIGILLLIASRIWGDRLLDAIDRRRGKGVPAGVLAVAGVVFDVPLVDDRSPWPASESRPSPWAPPDLTPPRGWVRGDHGPPAAGPVRDVDDDPATDDGSTHGEAGRPLT